MNNSDQIKVLNDLLAKSYDAEKGYKEAAEDVEAAHLKGMFREYADQRNNFGHEIKNIITSLGGDIDTGDTIASKLHRAWMGLKSAIASNEEKNILAEVVRGEENSLEHYQESLGHLDSGSSAYQTIVKQRDHVRSAMSKVESLLPAYSENEA